MTVLYLATNKIVGAVSGLPRDVREWVGEGDELAQIFRYRPGSPSPANDAIRPLVSLDNLALGWWGDVNITNVGLAALAAERSKVCIYAGQLKWNEVAIAMNTIGEQQQPLIVDSQLLEKVLRHIQAHWGEPDGSVIVSLAGWGPTNPLRVQAVTSDSDPDEVLARYYIAPMAPKNPPPAPL